MPAYPAGLRPERERPALGMGRPIVLMGAYIAFRIDRPAGQGSGPTVAHGIELRALTGAGQSVLMGIHSSQRGIKGPAGR